MCSFDDPKSLLELTVCSTQLIYFCNKNFFFREIKIQKQPVCNTGLNNNYLSIKYFDFFSYRFYGTGMEKFDHLVILHFHHDCTDHLLNIIAQNNHKTLKILDFSFSQNVTDSSVPALVQCELLHELDLLGSSLTIEAVTHILLKCKNLKM